MVLLGNASSATLEEGLATLRSATVGRIAFCKPSLVDELQIIGTPRELSQEEARELGALLGANETYFDKSAAHGTLANSFCTPHWDFKILLAGEDERPVVALRLCSSCRQVMLWVGDQPVDCPDIRKPAMTALTKHLDSWFPGWAEATKRNREAWEIESYRRSQRLRDQSKSSPPTPGLRPGGP